MRRGLTARDLGFEIPPGDERGLFCWLLASFLFGKRIAQSNAAATWRLLVEDHGLDSAARLCACGHARLVRLLGEGGYRRYDISTATRLLQLCARLHEHYGGRVTGIAGASADRADFERRLLEFNGVGPMTLAIFMREAGPALFGDAVASPSPRPGLRGPAGGSAPARVRR